MEDLKISRLDHLGIVSGTIKDLNIIEMIDDRIGTSKQEVISPGEAVAGMIYNGLGFTGEALYLSPHFFEDKPLNILFDRNDLVPKNFNADKLGNSLDALHSYGLENLMLELALSACTKENIDTKFKSLDTTSISLEGEYNSKDEEQSIKVKKGFSKDHRPDLKQVIHELLVTQDGGIPLLSKTWSGNANDSIIFKERANKIMEQFKQAKFADILIADSKLYSEANSTNLNNLNFITRIPSSIKELIKHVDKAINENSWTTVDENNKYKSYALVHYGISQRWIVVYSNSAHSRALKNAIKKVSSELANIKSKIKEINKQNFQCEHDVKKSVGNLIKQSKFHAIDYSVKEITKPNNDKFYRVKTNDINVIENIKQEYIDRKSCYVVGSNVPEEELSNSEVIAKYKAQNKSIENMGFRFMKDADMFTSSLFVKTPSRIEGLLFIMTLSLLVYSIAQRKLRIKLKEQEQSLPNQLNQPTQSPTLKWIFKLLKGINVAEFTMSNIRKIVFEGIDNLKERIISLFGVNARKMYGFQT